MNSSNRRKNVLLLWSVLLVFLAVTAVASAQKDKKSAPAPSKPAPHAAPAQHAGSSAKPSGAGGGAKPGGATTHAGGGAAAHAPGGASTNRGGAAGANRTGTAGATNRPGGANTNRGGAAGANKTGAAGATNRGTAGANANRGGPAGGNKGGTAGGANKGAAANASRGTAGHTPPGKNVSLKGGGKASIRPNGQVRSIDRGGMHIEHGVHGGRTVVGEHNGARVVNTGRHGGYVQRSYVNRGGHSYYSRTYYDHGRYRTGVYRGYRYGGRDYYGYYPGAFYHPGFYGWAYNPWASPVVWGVGAWGWGGAPWFGFYGGWFTPYPVYASPAFWLTDYLIAANLQAAYAAQAGAGADADAGDGGGGGGGPAPAAASGQMAMTPEVKQAIADEVKAQLAAQQAQAAQSGASAAPAAQAPANASGEVPPALDPARRTFVVDSDLSVVANGQECGLTAGDVITRLTDTPDADNMVNASVSASKKSDCASGQTVAVKVDDLQEMQNHFAEQLNNGLGELAKKQGTGGIPKAPDTGTTASDVPPPPADTTAAKTLQDQQQAADQTDSQVKQEAAGSGL